MINEAALRAFLDKHKNVSNKKLTDDILWYEFPKDTTRVVIQFLPPVHQYPIPGVYFYQHWLNTSNVKVINCLKSYDMPCPFCALLEAYKTQLDITEWESKAQSKVNVLVLQDPSYESRYQRRLDPNVPHVLSMAGEYLLNWLVKSIVDQDPNTGGDFTNPDQSFAWIFERERPKGKFKKMLSPIPRKLGQTPSEREYLLAKACDFSKTFKQPDDAYLQKVKESAVYMKEIIENKLLLLNPPTQPQIGQQAAPPQMLPNQNFIPATHITEPLPVTEVIPKPHYPVNPPQEVTPHVNHPTPVPTQPLERTVIVPPGSVTPGRNIPNKAPKCFGDKLVYNRESEVCEVCSWEYHCSTQLQMSKT